jgi:phosphate:Na+ symporter
VIVTAIVFYVANAIVHFPFMEMVMNPFSLAAANTIMRLFMILALFPFTSLIEKLVNFLIPLKPEDEELPTVHLEEMLLQHPAMALEQCRITIEDMAHLTQKGVGLALEMARDLSVDHLEEVRKLETAVDDYEDKLGAYLVKLTGRDMTPEQNDLVSKYLHTISDLELISDQALVIAIGTQQAHSKFGSFSGDAGHELEVMASAVDKVTTLATDAFTQNDLSLAERIEPLEEVIDNLCDTMKINHVDRLQKKICTINQGLVFNDIISGCERVSDHCSNIAVAMIVLGHDTLDMHEYLTNLREERSSAYETYYEQYKKEYDIELSASDKAVDAPFVRSASEALPVV